MFLPKFFELLTGCQGECKFLGSDQLILQDRDLLKLFFVQFVLRNGEVTFIFVSPRINNLEFVEFLFDHNFEVFPVYLVVFILCGISILGNKVYDFGVLEINRLKNYAALIISFDLLFNLIFLFLLFNFGCLL